MEVIKKSNVKKSYVKKSYVKKIKKMSNYEIKEKEELEKLYVHEKKSMVEISKFCGCHLNTIKNRLKKYKIPIRLNGAFLVDDDGETLNSKYKKGEITGGKYENIKAKKRGYENVNDYKKNLINKKRENDELPENCMWTKEELEDLYAYDKQNLTIGQIGKMHVPSVSNVVIGRWLNVFGIKRKTLSEANSGEHSSWWKGGISFNPYCEKFDNRVKEQLRDYWHRRCVLCNKTEEENGRKLSVHHVDYNKNQGCDSTKWKLITLCNFCNAKVNHNRNYYEHYFTNIIMIREVLEEFDYNMDWRSIGI